MSIIKQFISFTGVGVIGTTVHYLILLLWVEVFNIDPLSGVVLGSFGGAITNYVLNYKFTFNSNKKHHEAFPKFLLIAFIGILINLFLVQQMIDKWSLFYLYAQLIATIIVLLYNFSMNKVWTFRNKE